MNMTDREAQTIIINMMSKTNDTEEIKALATASAALSLKEQFIKRLNQMKEENNASS